MFSDILVTYVKCIQIDQDTNLLIQNSDINETHALSRFVFNSDFVYALGLFRLITMLMKFVV